MVKNNASVIPKYIYIGVVASVVVNIISKLFSMGIIKKAGSSNGNRKYNRF